MEYRCLGRPVTSPSMRAAASRSCDLIEHLGQVDLALGCPGGHHLLDLGVPPRVQGGERQVLQLPLDVLDAEPVGQRGVDVEGLLGGALLLPVRHGGDGPHVVQPVGQLDEQDPPVLGHGDEHLAHGRGLLGLLGVEPEPLELGDAVDDGGHHRAEARRSRSSTVTPVSSTASCSRAAARVMSSRPRSARMVATASGWEMYGSPDFRSWPSWAASATAYAWTIIVESPLGCRSR